MFIDHLVNFAVSYTFQIRALLVAGRGDYWPRQSMRFYYR